jgi:hypothetical protein
MVTRTPLAGRFAMKTEVVVGAAQQLLGLLGEVAV